MFSSVRRTVTAQTSMERIAPDRRRLATREEQIRPAPRTALNAADGRPRVSKSRKIRARLVKRSVLVAVLFLASPSTISRPAAYFWCYYLPSEYSKYFYLHALITGSGSAARSSRSGRHGVRPIDAGRRTGDGSDPHTSQRGREAVRFHAPWNIPIVWRPARCRDPSGLQRRSSRMPEQTTRRFVQRMALPIDKICGWSDNGM
jgi:hypothetical protein